ncbi:MAG: hypothetical protein P8M62_10305, partial [Opitutae bacterium]|nr:hypothetical protein [Opitutae bacterium]
KIGRHVGAELTWHSCSAKHFYALAKSDNTAFPASLYKERRTLAPLVILRQVVMKNVSRRLADDY